jgi:hypothetical protein
VDWIVHDSRPLTIVQSAYFKRLINELDPAFKIPDVKLVKQMIHRAYNHSVPLLKEHFQQHALKVSLTTDMWTSRSRKGYIGVTCSFVDKNWKLVEVTLTVQYVPYPHTANHIRETLENIINYWDLNGKIHIITTDNASTMKKAITDMNGVIWQNCSSHTLQLIIGKALKPCENLVARAKRLIDFFLRPKQSERLAEVQKNYPNKASVVIFFHF